MSINETRRLTLGLDLEFLSDKLINKKTCCEIMYTHISHVCHEHKDAFECPDNVVYYEIAWDEYGLINHDGGSSVYEINFCPWCGTRLPGSKRELWYDELERLGIVDPMTTEKEIPDKYFTDAWYSQSE